VKLRGYLLPLYAVAVLFPRLLELPFLPPGVQLTELLFPLLLHAYRATPTSAIRSPPFGSGFDARCVYGGLSPLRGGRFADHAQQASKPDELPTDFGRFDPHSSWMGAFSETGLLGFAALLVLTVVLGSYSPGANRQLAVLLFLFLVVALFKDVMNFRGLWLLIGCYLGWGGDAGAVAAGKGLPLLLRNIQHGPSRST
jgi:hypothetical protein